MKSWQIVNEVFRLAIVILLVCLHDASMAAAPRQVLRERVGPFGTGSNMMRCGVVHSSGVIYLGTYGPQPAIIWKFDPRVGKLQKIAAPGEYQLDSMVEAPNGMIYIGTAYEGLVYKLDPASHEIKNLGSPPIDSTSWIFTMLRTASGEVYGAKGVGLFRLDWKNDSFDVIGLVPGNHRTLGPNASNPIIRELVESPGGIIYGDTNRWLFRFNPQTREIEPLADMAKVDPACYALFLPHGGRPPTEDCYFTLFSRFSGEKVRDFFYVYRARSGKVEPLQIDGFSGSRAMTPSWVSQDGQSRLLVPAWHDDRQELKIAVVDPFEQKVVDQWSTNSNSLSARRLRGGDKFFFGGPVAGLLAADFRHGTFSDIASNPTLAECRCLAASRQGLLGTNTYDCGFIFTMNPVTRQRRDHGRVWYDEHRCNYGPAAFAGRDGRYFLANHSESMQSLWVTDRTSNRHWRIGPAANQLVAMSDGSVWGTLGRSGQELEFDPRKCWLPYRRATGGALFYYLPGEERIRLVSEHEGAELIAEAPRDGEMERERPDSDVAILLTRGSELRVYDPKQQEPLQNLQLPGAAIAMAHDARQTAAYVLLESGQLFSCRRNDGRYELEKESDAFGRQQAIERGFFVLPKSDMVIGVAGDGMVTAFNPPSNEVTVIQGIPPQPAGPAVDPHKDAWYYADREVYRYSLR